MKYDKAYVIGSDELAPNRLKKFRYLKKYNTITVDSNPLIITFSRFDPINGGINNTKIIPDEILRLTHNDGREIEFVLKSIVKPEPGHYTCFFNSKGDWYYYNDLKLCTNKNYLGLNDKGLKKIGSYSNLLKNRDSKLGCIYIYYPSDS